MKTPCIVGSSRREAGRARRWMLTGLWCGSGLLLATGCLYLPAPEAKASEGREVRPPDLTFLVPARTTKSEVILRFGQPTMFWRDENVLIYRWVKLRGRLLWAAASGYAGSFGAIEIPQEYAFLVKFDPANRFVNSETVEKPLGQAYGEFLLTWRDRQRALSWRPPQHEP